MQPEILYKSIRHGYARINKEGNLQLTIPNRFKNDKVFLENLMQKAQQLAERHAKKQKFKPINQEQVYIFGELCEISEVSPSKKKLPQVLKEMLYEYAEPLIKEYADKIGQKCSGLTIRKTRSKRGSCMPDQRIFLNLDLIHFPTKYIRYVVIHEVCHLKEKNHQKGFRNLVEKLCPNYKIIKKEMKSILIEEENF